MFDKARLQEILVQYKKDFVDFEWANEKYKWVAVQNFQENWDVNAEDFADMLTRSLSKTVNLLASMNNFPARMITKFAWTSPEEVRAMFLRLFDETVDVYERIKAFKADAAVMLNKHGKGLANHYQNENAITTYLWLRFPDKYYLYKFGDVKAAALELKSSYLFKKGFYADNIRNFYRFYDELNEELKKDEELVALLKSKLDSACYPDSELKTLTEDICFYISHYLKPNPPDGVDFDESDPELASEEWLPSLDEYPPCFTKEEWLDLLKNKNIIGPIWGGTLAAFYAEGGSATCSQIAQKYNKTAPAISGYCTNLAKSIHKKTRCPLSIRENGKKRYWPILFQGKKAGADIPGNFIWKLRPELYDALTEFGITSYQWPVESGGVAEGPDPEEKADVYTKADFLSEVYMSESRYDNLVGILKNKKNIILQGAPGVGKTFTAKRLAYSMMGVKDESRIEFVQFHQNYSYEDFMMGYRPVDDGFELKYGIFYRFCQKAAGQPEGDFFFIIDEINRGNMSKIFGELLMLIEKDYRGKEITLAYNGLPFSVPKNLYIIGMMNTADRSLAMIDYALRRRFSFFEMEPGFDSEGFIQYRKSLNSETLDELVERVKDLNKEITGDKSLGKGFCIGHSYFCGCDACTDEWLHSVVEYDILPMLSEYWFDDTVKLQKWKNILHGIFQ